MFEFLSFFIILFAAVFFSALFNRLHLPFVIALIIGGIIIGPYGIGVLQINETIDFLVRVRHLSRAPFKLKDRGVTCRIATLNEIKYLLKRRKIDFIDYQERLNFKHICFIAKLVGSKEIAGYCWLAVNKYKFPQTLLKIILQKDEGYVYNAYTFPKYRAKGVMPRLISKTVQYLYSHNYKKLYALVSTTNPAMMQHAVPKYRTLRFKEHFLKPLESIQAKSRNPFLQDLYDLFYLIRYFRSIYGMYF